MDEREKNNCPAITHVEAGERDELPANGESRRRFSKMGIGSAGVVLTLTSRSGMADTIANDCPSRVASKWHSGHSVKTTRADGRPPSYWCSNTTYWPHGCTPGTTTLGSVCGEKRSTLGKCTLLTVMKSKQSFDPHGVYMYAAATYLNILSLKVTFMTTLQLQGILYEYIRSGGIYKPTAGVVWGGPELATYLKNTCYAS